MLIFSIFYFFLFILLSISIFLFFFFFLLFRLLTYGASTPAYSSSGLILSTNGNNIRVSIGIGFVDAANNCSSLITNNGYNHIAGKKKRKKERQRKKKKKKKK
jgi:hypothetical protein